MVESFYDRDNYIASWSKILGCKSDAYSLAAALINKHKNFQSASAVLFGLSWRTHKEWLKKVSEYWQASWTVKDAVCTAEWCYAFQQHYITEVAKYPA